MSKAGKPKDVFDVQRLRDLIALMEEHDLSEVDLGQDSEKIKLVRGGVQPTTMMAPAMAAPPAAAASPAGSSAGGDTHAGTVTIDAPMVGTFYSKPTPESDVFVKPGDRINADTVVCIVEAMKVFNEIPAEVSGEVVEVLVDEGSPVDFGKPLIRIKPS